MFKNKKFQIDSVLLTNISFAFFPVCLILGNFVTNANFIFFLCLGIFHLKSKILKLNFDFLLKIIFLFFIAVFFSTSLSFINSFYFEGNDYNDFNRLIKSILFFRYFIMLLIIYLLSEYDIINYRYFFLSASFLALIVAADVIFQYIFGHNIIGLESYGHHNTSFFTDEYISGGFIQNFSFFSILLLTYVLRNSNDYFKIILISIVICMLAMGIMLSGNRMPFFLFLMGLFLIFFFNKKLRKVVITGFMMLFIIPFFIFSSEIDPANLPATSHIQKTYLSFYYNVNNMVSSIFEKKKSDQSEVILKEQEEFLNAPEALGYKKMIFTAFETWKTNKIFGSGIKSFREKCQKIVAEQKRGICSNHPHNYYLEVLTDLGIVGIFFVFGAALMFLVFLARNYKFLNINKMGNLFLLAAVISLFLEFFPIKSSGSIFTTNNTTYIILLSGIILSRKKIFQGNNFG